MSTKLAVTSGGGALFPEDVFSTWTYTGTGAAANIQNGVNLALGGMVWTKTRDTSAENHYLFDTLRGPLNAIDLSNGNNSPLTFAGSVTSFNNNGFSLGNASSGHANVLSRTYVSWTFRRAPRFFDVVTYTGTGAARTIPHALGVAPGLIFIKRTNTSSHTLVYHISAGAGNYFTFDGASAATASTTMWNNTAPTVSNFSLGADIANTAGGSYIAYLFAHDPSPDGMIQCGSFTGNVTTLPSVTLGWEPQWMMFKANFATVAWTVADVLRGMSLNTTNSLQPTNANSESAGSEQVGVTPTGFRMLGSGNNYNRDNNTMYYVAVRRGRKPPTSASSVFTPFTYSGNGGAGVGVTSAGFPLDLLISRVPAGTNEHGWFDRVRGTPVSFGTATLTQTLSGSTSDLTSLASMNGYSAGADSNRALNTATTIVSYALRRARGFMDIVAFTGNGAISHSLEAVPEMMIMKSTSSGEWRVYHSALGNTQYAVLNTNAAAVTSSTYWNNTSPTTTQFTAGTAFGASTWIAYLFASLAGISKVGSYTGNGTSQTINCGFAAGARLVLVKRTSANGPATTTLCNGWNLADTARGISASADPTSALNSISADLSPNWLTPASSGFTVVQDSNNDMNVNGATYIYLAIA